MHVLISLIISVEELAKKKQEVESIHNEEDATKFFEQTMSDLIKMASEGQDVP